MNDLKMILDCGISDPDEEDKDDKDEEDEKMEPTSVWRIENIDDIWITQDVDGMSLMFKNKDDITKIVMTGDAIDNFNDKFVISPQADMIEYAKNMRKLEKENKELKAKSNDISNDNALFLTTNVQLLKKKSWLEQRVERLLNENMKLREEYEKLLEGSQPKEDKKMSDIKPLVIVFDDKFNGIYSGGKWTAWNMCYVPSKIFGDEKECADFFAKENLIFGRGETPEEAIEDLKHMRYYGSHMIREHIKAVSESTENKEDENMKATSVQNIKNVKDICFSIEVDEIEMESKLTIVASTNDDIFAFEFEGSDLLQSCKKVGLFTGWENDETIKRKNREINELNQKLYQVERDKERLTDRYKDLEKHYNELSDEHAALRNKTIDQMRSNELLKRTNQQLKEEKEKIYKDEIVALIHGVKYTVEGLVDRILELEKLEKENEELKKKNKKLNHAADYWSKQYDILLEKFAKSQVKLAELKTPTIEYFADEETADNVNHPSHYTGKYECIDVMQDVFGDEATNNFCLCNAFKYIWRARKKNGLEDVKKAVWYLNKYIEEAEKDGQDKSIRRT